MISKIVTMTYLTSLCCTIWLTSRHRLRLAEELMLHKALIVLSAGYSLAIFYIYTHTFHGGKPFLLLAMLSLSPFAFVLLRLLKNSGYDGELNLLILALMLNSIGMVMLYRLDISSGWFLARLVGYDGNVPMALKQLVHTMIALFGVTLGLSRGVFMKIIKAVDMNRHTLVWGLAAFALLAFPKLFGFSTMLGQDTSFQPSEFAFKILFLVFVSKYYAFRSSELVLAQYPLREVVKLVLFLSLGIAAFFFIPLVFLQQELGTVLLIGLTFIILTSYVTGRISFFVAGLALITVALFTGVTFSGHVERRLIGAWLEWRDFAFKPFHEGENIYPGYQLFMSIATIRLSPWGVGLGNGILTRLGSDQTIHTIVPKAVHDFIAIPVMAEMGVLAIAIISLGYLVFLYKAISGRKSLSFPNILSAGIAIALLTQGLYNLSCVTTLLPMTGIPLPWVSYGGSAIFANYILAGVLMASLNEEGKSGEER